MSRKAQTFAGIITQPLNIYNFIVDIPDLDLSVIVSSTTMPTEKLGKIEKWFQGEPIRYPSRPTNDGVWKVTIPENDDGKVRKQFDAIKHQIYNQKEGTLNTNNLWKDVTVTLRDMADNPVCSTILHGVWLVGREPLDLSNNDVTKSVDWQYEFCYQWLEDVDLENAGSSQQFRA